MSFDRRAADHDRVNQSVATDSRPVPGKRTLTTDAMASDRFVQRHEAAPQRTPVDPGVHAAAAHGMSTPATRLPHADRIQRLFGRHDITGIQAHVGPEAAATAGEMGAQAYATGGHVVLGEGAGLHTVAHEAAHVIQQRGGVQLKGGVGEAGDAYERRADEVADRIVRGESAEGLLGSPGSNIAPHDSRAVQLSSKRQYMPGVAGGESAPQDEDQAEKAGDASGENTVDHDGGTHFAGMPPLIGDPPDEAGGAAPESGAWREKEEQKEEKDKAKGASEDPHDARARCSDDPVLVATRKHGKGRRGPGERRQRRELQPRRREREQRELEREEQRELERQQRERQLGNAVQDLSLALDGLVWAVQGSYAAVLHGAPIEAGDIDVLVKDVPTALNALFIGGFHLEGGTLLVYKLKHRNDTDIDLVSTGGGDFGIDPANRVSMGGVYVMNLCEVLKSLLMRPKRRDKDVIAFIWLVLHKGDTLDEQQRESIALLATKDRQTHIPGLEECQSWEQLVIKLREHASEPKTTTRA